MKSRDIKEIHITGKEWFDKINGNSYFSARIMVTTKKRSLTIYVPFQYGYGDHYKDVAFDAIRKELNCFKNVIRLWQAADKYKIKIYCSKQENQLKRDAIQWGTHNIY